MLKPSSEHLITDKDFSYLIGGTEKEIKERDEIISFIMEIFKFDIKIQEDSSASFIEFDDLLDQMFAYDCDPDDEQFKFALESTLNYLIISKILAVTEIEFDEDETKSLQRFYSLTISEYIH